MHLGCCSTFGKHKNTLACGSSIFTLSESLAASLVHGSRNPARKTIRYSFILTCDWGEIIPPCQHSLWEETGVPRKKPWLSVERCATATLIETPLTTFLPTAARRIQETMLHKRHSLSESFMNLIDGNKELLNHLNSCRKGAQSNLSNK
jgi:hypothetical protein